MLFDVSEITVDSLTPEEKSGAIAVQFLKLHGERIESIKHLSNRFPRDGEAVCLWTVNSFNAFTFIPYIIKECGIIEELIISTYSINIRIIDALVKLIDSGKIKQVEIFISDSIRSMNAKVHDHLMAFTENKPVRIIFAWNHSKIALIKTADHYFDVEGSGNWGENAKHEQYVFFNSRTIYEFRKNEILYGIERRPD